MSTYTYEQTVNAGKLTDELIAAIPALAPVTDGDYLRLPFTVAHTPTEVRITVPDSVPQAAVDAVLAAHTTAPSASQISITTQDGNDRDALTSFALNYSTMLTKLNSIQTDMSAISTRANTLSNITVSGTLAQTQAQLQSVLRNLGTDLKTLVDDFSAVSVGLERQLKMLAAVKRLGNIQPPPED